MPTKRQFVEEVSRALEEPGQLEAIKSNPGEAIPKLVNKAVGNIQNDKGFWYIALIALAVLALTAAGGALTCAIIEIETPESLIAIGSAAVGAIVGLFADSPVKS